MADSQAKQKATSPPPKVLHVARRKDNTINVPEYVWARILYPALGFPAVVGPAESITQQNGTSSIHLLLLSARNDLNKPHVARHLRYVPWDKRRTRYLETDIASCAFPANAMKVDSVNLGTNEEFSVQVTFARGFIRANLALDVLRFYKDAGLEHLYEVTIYEWAASKLKAGLYNFFWNDPPHRSKNKEWSREMDLLSTYFYAERRRLSQGEKKLPIPPEEEYRYELGHRSSDHVTEVLHPLFVRETAPEQLDIGHLTDPHLCIRAQTFEERLKGPSKTSAKKASARKFYNNYNTRFAELYLKARASDLILLTGDIIDYCRGYKERNASLGDIESYQMDRNWFLFYELLAAGDQYSTPVYTVLGNHDWRIHPYPPLVSVSAIDKDVQLTPKELTEAHGPEGDRLLYGSSTNRTLTQVAADLWPISTCLNSVKWYLFLINPFLDYVVRFPGGYTFLMLDWAEEELDFSRHPDYPMELNKWHDVFLPKVGLPVAKRSLTALQKDLVQWFASQPDSAKAIGLHAGIVSPDISKPDDVLQNGILMPCPVCGGAGSSHSRVLTPEGIRFAEQECDCTRMELPQPVDKHKAKRRPYLALNKNPVEETKTPDKTMPVHGTIKHHRDWLIQFLQEKKIPLVLSGHSHRNTLFSVLHERGEADQPAGTALLIAPHELAQKAKSYPPPLFVNTSSSGPFGWGRPSQNQWVHQPPCWAKISFRRDGTVEAITYDVSPIPQRAMDSKGDFTDDELKVKR